MKRIAVIFESSPFDRKGLFNAVHNRVKGLMDSGECWVDAYCIHSSDNAFTRRVRHVPYAAQVDHVEIDGITYKMLWYRFSILDHITLEKLGRRPLFFRRFLESHISLFEGYDLLIAHSFTGALFAYEASRRYGIPYFANWHGSDVHTHPWRVPVICEDTRKVMENAKHNFFVSNALMEYSSRITTSASKEVLYNGVSENFMRFDEDGRRSARARFSIPEDSKVVAFVGNLSAVKNVLTLPEIFTSLGSQYEGKLHFVIAGDGKLRRSLEAAFDMPVTFLGNVPSDDMPVLMNCVDVLVLPSLNEGLPLVCAEALRCGANVVGSDVGGIAEVIGNENVAPLGDGFVERIASRIVEMLTGDIVQQLPSDISWSRTAARELEIISAC